MGEFNIIAHMWVWQVQVKSKVHRQWWQRGDTKVTAALSCSYNLGKQIVEAEIQIGTLLCSWVSDTFLMYGLNLHQITKYEC